MSRTLPYLYILSRTILYLNTFSRTIPYLNTLSRTIPYLNTLSRTIPYLNTLSRTIPYLNTLPSAANEIRVLRHPSRRPIRIECTSPESSRLGLKNLLGSRLQSPRFSLSYYIGSSTPPPPRQLCSLLYYSQHTRCRFSFSGKSLRSDSSHCVTLLLRVHFLRFCYNPIFFSS